MAVSISLDCYLQSRSPSVGMLIHISENCDDLAVKTFEVLYGWNVGVGTRAVSKMNCAYGTIGHGPCHVKGLDTNLAYLGV